jgi:hypothetical protein
VLTNGWAMLREVLPQRRSSVVRQDAKVELDGVLERGKRKEV